MFEKVFYCIYQNDDDVPSNKPVRLEKARVLEIAREVAAGEKNFLGFVDAAGTTLQFFVDEIGKIWMEIPNPKERGSYGIHIDEARLLQLLETLHEPFEAYKASEQMQFTPW